MRVSKRVKFKNLVYTESKNSFLLKISKIRETLDEIYKVPIAVSICSINNGFAIGFVGKCFLLILQKNKETDYLEEKAIYLMKT